MSKSEKMIKEIESLIHSSNNYFNVNRMRSLLSKLNTRGKLTNNLKRRAQNRNLTWMAKHYYHSNGHLSSGNSNFYNSNTNWKNEAKNEMIKTGFNKSRNIAALTKVRNYYKRKANAAPNKPYSIMHREFVRLLNKRIKNVGSYIRNMATGARETGRRKRI